MRTAGSWRRLDDLTADRRARAYALRALAGVLALSLVAVVALALLLPALRFTPGRPERTTPGPPPTTSLRAALARADASPAAGVVAALLRQPPAGLPAGLVDSSSVPGTVAPAVAATCDSPVSPVLSRSRTWARPAGPGGFGTGVTVTASAYSAGAGAPAMDAMLTARRSCIGDASVRRADGPGVQAVRVRQSKGAVDTRSVVFRRGDVLVSVSGTGMDVPDEVATDLDRRLQGLLGPTCREQSSTTADFVRSPLISRQSFVGLQVPTTVPLPPQGEPLPDLVQQHVGQPLPEPVTPTTPAEPYWPETAPAPTPSPVEPSPPVPYPVSTGIKVPRQDELGPGCGWAFTGMSPAAWDQHAADRTIAERRDGAVQAMRAAVAAYPAAAQAYERAWQDYDKQAQAYTAYITQAQEVEAAWAVIRAQQEAYQQALASYQVAMQAYQTDLQHRADLQKAYDDAVVACATGGTPTPAPPSPTPAGSATDTGTTTPSPLPTPSTVPTTPTMPPVPTMAPGCPPTPDPVLSLPVPTAPTSPTPPPDPRPTPRP